MTRWRGQLRCRTARRHGRDPLWHPGARCGPPLTNSQAAAGAVASDGWPRVRSPSCWAGASAGFVGRLAERAVLGELADPEGTVLVVHLHGVAGVGKSTLLQVVLDDARARGATVFRLDCRAIEPTERGFLHELGAAIDGAADDVQGVAVRLSGLGSRVVVALDNYEVFRLMDTWMRQ